MSYQSENTSGASDAPWLLPRCGSCLRVLALRAQLSSMAAQGETGAAAPQAEGSSKRRTRTRWWRVVRWLLLGGVALLFLTVIVLLSLAWRPMGQMATGERLARMERSPRWKDDKFHDVLAREEPELLKILPKWFEEPYPYRRPEEPLTHRKLSRKDFETAPSSGLRITWLGHSSLIIEIDGKRLLVDPVWGQYVAPFELKNAKRFIPPPLPFSELPEIDMVVISHDHYDHLDYPTILRLKETQVPFLVPLGVGAHLEYWGIEKSRIIEQEWWDEYSLGELTIVCTPARHFSGRSLVDKDKTLWSGWAVVGPSHRVYYSGDTAMFPGFAEIGERYGPFDATMMESGAYNALWADVHLGPEQAVAAHQMLGGRLLIPVHWGMFDLGLHGWTEPMERILAAAERSGVRTVTLRPGQSVEPRFAPTVERWWPERPWQRAEEAPIVSSGLR